MNYCWVKENLGAREIYIKMPIDGKTEDPFSAKIISVDAPRHPSFREKIIERSRAKYSRTLDEAKEDSKITDTSAATAAAEESLPPPV